MISKLQVSDSAPAALRAAGALSESSGFRILIPSPPGDKIKLIKTSGLRILIPSAQANIISLKVSPATPPCLYARYYHYPACGLNRLSLSQMHWQAYG